MTDFATLEVNREETNCLVAGSVKYVPNLQRKLLSPNIPAIMAMQYHFCSFLHTDIVANTHTGTHHQGESDNAVHRPIKADIKQSVMTCH